MNKLTTRKKIAVYIDYQYNFTYYALALYFETQFKRTLKQFDFTNT